MWNKLKNRLKAKFWGGISKGQGHIFVVMIMATFVGAIAVIMIPLMMAGSSVSASIQRLEGDGEYVVMTIDQYNALFNLLISVDTKADAAVTNAEAAALAANQTLETLLLHNENEVFLFPEAVTANATMTAGNGSDLFGAWTEIVDTGADTLTAKFAANDGYLVELTTRDYSDANEIHVIEIATDAAGANVIGRVKVRSDWTYILTLKSTRVTAGDTIYYRMKAETALATLSADFRYYHR
jgi:hypothetical protein